MVELAPNAEEKPSKGLTINTEANAEQLIGSWDSEKRLAQYEQYRETVKGRIIIACEKSGHPEMASALVKGFFNEPLNPDQQAQYDAWQPSVAEQGAMVELSQALQLALANKARPHEGSVRSDLRIHPAGGPSEQQALDLQQGENLAYSILISQKQENYNWEQDRAEESKDDRILREAAGGGAAEAPKWQPREYETIIPGAILDFKDPAEAGSGPLAEFRIDSKKQ